ncbi:laminin G domain-containing protein [Pontiellaceae bacterium B12219]|nr:laminin G domain-containing protein [Pontiellaceae bacterium B12219]
MKISINLLCILMTGFISLQCTAQYVQAESPNILPKGLMLNLDFEDAANGLIPSKSLFPLFVPQQGLTVSRINHRNLLELRFGQGLSIPHSSLLDPAGDEWIISIRIFALTDGLIISQGNSTHGFVIYMKDGQIMAKVRTAHTTFTLEESARRGITKYKNRWCTIELRIEPDRALLSLNRERVAQVSGEPALSGEDLRIHLGNHNELPAILSNFPGLETTGFTGAIGSLKIHRQ